MRRLTELIDELELEGKRHRHAAILILVKTKIYNISAALPERLQLLETMYGDGGRPLGLMILDYFDQHAELVVKVYSEVRGDGITLAATELRKAALEVAKVMLAGWNARDVHLG